MAYQGILLTEACLLTRKESKDNVPLMRNNAVYQDIFTSRNEHKHRNSQEMAYKNTMHPPSARVVSLLLVLAFATFLQMNRPPSPLDGIKEEKHALTFQDDLHFLTDEADAFTTTTTRTIAHEVDEDEDASISRSSIICSANTLIQDSYKRWYRPFIEECQEDVVECVQHYINDISPANSSSSLPWWLYSLLVRVKQKPGASSGWHYFSFKDPQLELCAIEKVAITQWKNINHRLHGTVTPSGWGRWTPSRSTTSNYTPPRAVFLRDPLERFLSGYLNKCVQKPKEGHCEPNFIYNSFPDNDHVAELSTKHHFESFIASIPFGWNHHFVPQAFFCHGLFRTVQEYAFVGNMDSDVFVRDLKRFQNQFPGAVAEAVQEVYHLDEQEDKFRTVLEKMQAGHFTNAPKQVFEYYSAESVRQVLKYLAIDYVTLNLTVPTWVDEILTHDCQIQSMME